MDFIAISAIIIMVIATLWWVLSPIFNPQGDQLAEEMTQDYAVAELLLRRDALYAAIKDLEQDAESGKITSEDYTRLRAKLTRQAAQVLKALDAHQSEDDKTLEAEIDALLAQYQQKLGQEQASIEVTCLNCGHQHGPKDSFCAQCGHKLTLNPANQSTPTET